MPDCLFVIVMVEAVSVCPMNAIILLELEYAYCSSKKAVPRMECRDSCEAMNTEGRTGWTLAVIPTKYHNNKVTHTNPQE